MGYAECLIVPRTKAPRTKALSHKEPIMGMFALRSDGQRSAQKAVIGHKELVAIKRPFVAYAKLARDQIDPVSGRLRYGQLTIKGPTNYLGTRDSVLFSVVDIDGADAVRVATVLVDGHVGFTQMGRVYLVRTAKCYGRSACRDTDCHFAKVADRA